MKLIGIVAKKQSGKTTIADYLCENYNYIKISFADALKQVLYDIFGFNCDQLYGNKKEETDEFWKITPRNAMQIIGTELFRNDLAKYFPDIKQDIWVKIVERKIMGMINEDINIVIDDIRFQNELDLIKKLNGKIIYINKQTHQVDGHESEQISIAYVPDYTINNDKDIQNLYNQIDQIMNFNDSKILMNCINKIDKIIYPNKRFYISSSSNVKKSKYRATYLLQVVNNKNLSNMVINKIIKLYKSKCKNTRKFKFRKINKMKSYYIHIVV